MRIYNQNTNQLIDYDVLYCLYYITYYTIIIIITSNIFLIITSAKTQVSYVNDVINLQFFFRQFCQKQIRFNIVKLNTLHGMNTLHTLYTYILVIIITNYITLYYTIICFILKHSK